MLLLIVAAFVLGLVVGSFLNNVIFRLQAGETFIKGRSRCPQCRHKLSWRELIPVFSFLYQRGCCRECEGRIDRQYPWVEFATGALFALSLYLGLHACYGGPAALGLCTAYDWLSVLRNWTVVSFLLLIFVYDLRWQLILDQISLPAIIVVLALNLSLAALAGQGIDAGSALIQSLLNMLAAALAGGGFFLLQFIISKGKWIGGGDIRLGLLMGVIVGWPNIIWALMIAYLVGALVSVGLIVIGSKEWKSQIPFGTFLCAATLLTLFWGDEIVSWYLNLLI